MTSRYIDTGSGSGSASVPTQKQRGQEFFMNTGEKVTLKKIVRSQKTGMYLPKEGTLVDITENFGRRLLLVAFDDGNCEYLFDDEVECFV